MEPENRISACVTAGNEEQKIRRCLESLKWCDEIVVVDSFSKDRTVEISREYTDRVYQCEWMGYIGQKNYIRSLARYPWVLFLDADEMVSTELRDEILAEFRLGTGEWAGFRFPRQVYYLGRWIRHGEWYPDMKLRLFRKELGHSEGQEPHDRVFVNGPVKTLKGHLYHFTYDDILDHIATMNRYSTITAQGKFAQGKEFRWRDLLFRPLWRFGKNYVFQRGMLDGMQGFVIAAIISYGVAIKYIKLWELSRLKKAAGVDP